MKFETKNLCLGTAKIKSIGQNIFASLPSEDQFYITLDSPSHKNMRVSLKRKEARKLINQLTKKLKR